MRRRTSPTCYSPLYPRSQIATDGQVPRDRPTMFQDIRQPMTVADVLVERHRADDDARGFRYRDQRLGFSLCRSGVLKFCRSVFGAYRIVSDF